MKPLRIMTRIMMVVVVLALFILLPFAEARPLRAGVDTNMTPEGTRQEIGQAVNRRIRDEFRERDLDPLGSVLGVRDEMRSQIRNQWNNLTEEQQERFRGLENQQKLRRVAVAARGQLHEIASLSEEELETLSGMGRARIEGLSNKSIEEIREEVEKANLTDLRRITMGYKVRQIAQDRTQKLREQYTDIEERQQTIRNRLENRRDAFLDIVNAGNETEAIELAREYADTYAEGLIAYLEKVQNRVESNANIDSETASRYTEELQTLIEEVEGLQSELAAAETKDEIKGISAELRELTQEVRNRGGAVAGAIVSKDVGEVVIRAQHLEKRAEAALLFMEEKGIETDELDALIDEFSETVEDARERYEEGHALFVEARMDADGASVQEAREIIQTAHVRLRDAYDIYREIWSILQEEGFQMDDFQFDSEELEYEVDREDDPVEDQEDPMAVTSEDGEKEGDDNE